MESSESVIYSIPNRPQANKAPIANSISFDNGFLKVVGILVLVLLYLNAFALIVLSNFSTDAVKIANDHFDLGWIPEWAFVKDICSSISQNYTWCRGDTSLQPLIITIAIEHNQTIDGIVWVLAQMLQRYNRVISFRENSVLVFHKKLNDYYYICLTLRIWAKDLPILLNSDPSVYNHLFHYFGRTPRIIRWLLCDNKSLFLED